MKPQVQHFHRVEVQFLAGHKKNNSENEKIQVSSNETISDIIGRLNIDRELVCAAFFDGTFLNFDTRINRDGKLMLLPAVGGG